MSSNTPTSNQQLALNDYFSIATKHNWDDIPVDGRLQLFRARENVVSAFRGCNSLAHAMFLFTESQAWKNLFKEPKAYKIIEDSNKALRNLAVAIDAKKLDPKDAFQVVLDAVPGDIAGVRARVSQNLKDFAEHFGEPERIWRFGQCTSLQPPTLHK